MSYETPSANYKSVLKLSEAEALDFFLKGESYSSVELPPYFAFDDLISKVNEKLSGKNLSDFIIDAKSAGPREFDDVNHVIFNNKDGKYAWRPQSLIHPALYVSLVHKITDADQWDIILKRFEHFGANPKLVCLSYPAVSLSKKKDKAEQVLHWWLEVEQSSLELAMDYQYLFQTDITDCYGAIYTHSIAWALHGKSFAKKKENKGDLNLIGNQIDKHIQDMSQGQTNGIPEQSALTDFIAEMVLGYSDTKLSQKIEDSGISDYHILRYRDDYRVFVNNPQDGERIVKLLTEVLLDLGMKLNPNKTSSSSEVVHDSIKPDKLFWMEQKTDELNLQKQLLLIHNLSREFPNSGSLITALTQYFKGLGPLANLNMSPIPAISIVLDIAINNPRVYAISTAVMSKLLSFVETKEQKELIDKIKKRFDLVPNTGHLQIWLQRITITSDPKQVYKEPLCRIPAGLSPVIWNSEWLAESLRDLIDPDAVYNEGAAKKLKPVISNIEVDLFMAQPYP